MADGEACMLLRLPEDLAERVRASLRSGEAMGEVNVVFGPEPTDGSARAARFSIGGEELPAALSNLPTVIEVHKSIDDVTFYKTIANTTGMIRQVLEVAHDADCLVKEGEHPHGLTPPLLDVRKHKWRKREARDPQKVLEVALELDSLMNGGRTKVDYVWEDVWEPDESGTSASSAAKQTSATDSASVDTTAAAEAPEAAAAAAETETEAEAEAEAEAAAAAAKAEAAEAEAEAAAAAAKAEAAEAEAAEAAAKAAEAEAAKAAEAAAVAAAKAAAIAEVRKQLDSEKSTEAAIQLRMEKHSAMLQKGSNNVLRGRIQTELVGIEKELVASRSKINKLQKELEDLE